MSDLLRPRVLLVDDDLDLLAAMRMAAVTAPFDLDTVSDGEEALRLCRAARQTGQPYAGLVLDGVMPGLSGYAIASRVRERDDAIHIAFFTAHVNDLWRHWAGDLKVSAFWEKPLDPAQLIAHMEAWLQDNSVEHPTAMAATT